MYLTFTYILGRIEISGEAVNKMFIIWLVIVVSICLGSLYPRSKKLFYLITVLMMVLEGGYDGNVDLNIYRLSYEGAWSATSKTDLYIFHALEKACYSIGIPFQIFCLILGAISVFLIAYVVYKISDKPAFVMASITGFAMLENMAQKKTLYATAILIFALYFFFLRMYGRPRYRVRDIVVYTLLIITATGMHYFAIIFIGFLVCGKMNDKSMLRVVVLADFVLLFFENFLLSKLSIFFTSLTTYTDIEHVKPISTLMYITWQVIGTVIIIRQYKREMRNQAMEEYSMKLLHFVYLGSILMLIILPFYFVSGVTSRIFRAWFIFILISQGVFSRHNFTVNIKELPMGLYNWGSLIWFYMVMFVLTGRGAMTYFITELVENNIFW